VNVYYARFPTPIGNSLGKKQKNVAKPSRHEGGTRRERKKGKTEGPSARETGEEMLLEGPTPEQSAVVRHAIIVDSAEGSDKKSCCKERRRRIVQGGEKGSENASLSPLLMSLGGKNTTHKQKKNRLIDEGGRQGAIALGERTKGSAGGREPEWCDNNQQGNHSAIVVQVAGNWGGSNKSKGGGMLQSKNSGVGGKEG